MDERDLQARLRQAVGGSGPDSNQLWEDIMSEATHAQKMRNAKRGAAALAIAALAVAIPVAINLASPDEKSFVTPGSDSPTATPSWGVGQKPHLDARMNVMLDVPRGYEVGEFEGHVDIRPGFLPSPNEGGATAWFEMFPEVVDPRDGAPNDSIGRRDAWRTESPTGESGTRIAWVVSWPPGLALPGGAEEPAYITVSIAASTASMWTDYENELRDIVDSVRIPSSPANGGEDISTRFGRIDVGAATIDNLTLTAAAFLDERIYGDPTIFLTSEARQQYTDLGELPGGDPWLTALGTGAFESYRIVARRDADANSAEFDLELTYVIYGEPERRYTVSETIGVGFGENHQGDRLSAVVRFVTGSVEPQPTTGSAGSTTVPAEPQS